MNNSDSWPLTPSSVTLIVHRAHFISWKYLQKPIQRRNGWSALFIQADVNIHTLQVWGGRACWWLSLVGSCLRRARRDAAEVTQWLLGPAGGVKWLLNVLFTFLPPQIRAEPPVQDRSKLQIWKMFICRDSIFTPIQRSKSRQTELMCHFTVWWQMLFFGVFLFV